MKTYWPATCNEIFERHWRTQIEQRLVNPDDHPMALLGIIACMELAYCCKKALPLARTNEHRPPSSTQILKYYFPKNKFPGADSLGNALTNGLKHNAFIRPSIWLQDKDDEGSFIPEPIKQVNGKIKIAPTAFWNHVEKQISEIFSEKRYPFEFPKVYR